MKGALKRYKVNSSACASKKRKIRWRPRRGCCGIIVPDEEWLICPPGKSILFCTKSKQKKIELVATPAVSLSGKFEIWPSHLALNCRISSRLFSTGWSWRSLKVSLDLTSFLALTSFEGSKPFSVAVTDVCRNTCNEWFKLKHSYHGVP